MILEHLSNLSISTHDIERYILDLIRKCCHYEAGKRPEFKEILKMISAIEDLWSPEVDDEDGLAEFKDEYYYLTAHKVKYSC